jgi:hypothetical protein
MLRIVPTVAAGDSKRSSLRALLVAAWLVAAMVPAALAQADQSGTISVDGPSARLTLPITDPITCGASAGVGAGENWPPLCIEVTSAADDGGATPYAFSGTLTYDPDRVYYDADEDLVHAYHGVLAWHGAQSAPALGSATASVELTATKEGHQSGVLVVVLNGIADIPIGTRLSVSLVGLAR